QLHGDDVAVDVHGVDATVGEQPPGQLVRWPVAHHVGTGGVPQVAHASQHAVGLEPQHAGLRCGPFGDDDRLTHGARNHTGWVRSVGMADAPGRAPVPWRTIGAVVVAAIGAYIGFETLIALQRILTWLVVAAFFAIVLNPAVDFLVHQAKMRR